jgi:hypothetical protein
LHFDSKGISMNNSWKTLGSILFLITASEFAGRLEAQVPMPAKTTEVMVMMTIKPGIERAQLSKFMPGEVRSTVRLYLDGKIRQWYSRADGKGVIFILNATSAAEAQATMETLPLAKANVVNEDYVELAPLAPLGSLIGPPSPKP